MATGSFKMTLDNQKKQLYIYAEGVFTPDIGQAFTNEFLAKAKSVDSKEYTLIVDVKNLNTSTPEVAAALGNVLQLYFSVPFKKRYMTKINNVIAQMQVQKLGSSIPKFDELVFVDTVDNIK